MSLNIANNYNILEEPEQAIVFAKRGVELLEELGDTENLPLALGILGTAQMKAGEWEAASATFARSLAFAEANGENWTTAITLGDIGDLRMRQERFPEALSRMGMLYANPAFALHDDPRALDYLRKAADLCEESDTAILLVSIYETLIELYDRQNRSREALTYSRRLREMERRLFNQQSDQRIRRLQIRFEVEKAQKDNEIAHLRSVELAGALEETERQRLLAEDRARTDALTGVSNRRSMEERLAEEIKRARRYRRPLSVALIDVDHFKRINDTLGHGTGDLVLTRIAALLRAGCREGSGDQVARYGGEEFVLVLPETGTLEAERQCERLRERVASEDWKAISPHLSGVTTSIGLATTLSEATAAEDSPGDVDKSALNVESILILADKNLYAAKREGRNRVISESTRFS